MKCVWLKCGECGKEFEKPKKEYDRRVRKGVVVFYCSLICSCIHSNKVSPRKGDPEFGHRGYKKRSSKVDPELAPFKWFIRRALNRIRKFKHGETTDLTNQYLKDLFDSQNGRCPISGLKLTLPTGTSGWITGNRLTVYSASLDRIDNSKGYLQGNVRFVSVMANYARNIFTDEEVIEFCRAVTEYNKSK